MMAQETLFALVKYVLPQELVNYFDLVDIKEEGVILHLYLEESDVKAKEYDDIELFSNGFYQ
jgi:hypothetical protein